MEAATQDPGSKCDPGAPFGSLRAVNEERVSHSDRNHIDEDDFLGGARCYSWRSALIGSPLMARRAGMQHAATATSVSEIATAANVIGSVGLMPNRRLLMKRVSASEAPRPMAT